MQDNIVSCVGYTSVCVNGSADIMVSRYVAPFHIIVGGISCCSTLRVEPPISAILFIQCLQYYTLTTECLFRSTIYKSSE